MARRKVTATELLEIQYASFTCIIVDRRRRDGRKSSHPSIIVGLRRIVQDGQLEYCVGNDTVIVPDLKDSLRSIATALVQHMRPEVYDIDVLTERIKSHKERLDAVMAAREDAEAREAEAMQAARRFSPLTEGFKRLAEIRAELAKASPN